MSVDPAFPFLIAVIHNSKGTDNATIMQQFRVNYYELPARNTLNNTHENGWSGIMQEGVVWSITGCQPVEYYLYSKRAAATGAAALFRVS